MAILSKACKPDNFESHNSLKLSFTNIRGLHLNFVDFESFLESNFLDIVALCETNLDDSVDSGNFSERGYLPLIRKDSSTHAWSRSLCERRLPFALGLSLENSADSYLCFRLTLFHSVSYFFFLSTHLLMFLSLATLTFIIRTGLTILVELIDLVNSVINFLSQMTLLRWLTFLLGSQTY